MIPRIQCKRCGSQILLDTAHRHRGLCAVCAKNRSFSALIRSVAAFAGVVGILFAAPVVGTAMFFKTIWMRIRFPFDVKILKVSIAAVHSDRQVCTAYLSGIIEGYYSNSPVFAGFAQNPPYMWGKSDGGRLKRGELAISEIPSHREVFFFHRPPGVKYKASGGASPQ